MRQKLLKGFIVTTFISLYLVVSIISTIHVIDFFKLSNPEWLAISLAVAFEIGATASLASIIAMDKMNKTLVWFLFIILTMMQMMGNTFYAFTHLENYQSWVELFGLIEEETIYQKRILSIISGGILPVVALGFIKSLVDYIRPDKDEETKITELTTSEPISDNSPEVSPKKTKKAKRGKPANRKLKNKDKSKDSLKPTENAEIIEEPVKPTWSDVTDSITEISKPLTQSNDSEKSQVSEIIEDAGDSKLKNEIKIAEESFNQEPDNNSNVNTFEEPAQQNAPATQESLIKEEINNIDLQSNESKNKARMHPQIMPGVLE
jgi:hypothetical protein